MTNTDHKGTAAVSLTSTKFLLPSRTQLAVAEVANLSVQINVNAKNASLGGKKGWWLVHLGLHDSINGQFENKPENQDKDVLKEDFKNTNCRVARDVVDNINHFLSMKFLTILD